MFVEELKKEEGIKGNCFNSVWREYERVIIESLITSFGLDFLVRDSYGGDVDTIINVRKIGTDAEINYKNPENEKAYENSEKYDSSAYHSDKAFREIKHNDRDNFNRTGEAIEDTYVSGNKLYLSHAAGVPEGNKAELDHVIAAKRIAEDRGRILSGLDGMELANDRSNLRYTNDCINRNKADKSAEEYIKWCEDNPGKVNWNGQKGTPLSENVKRNLRMEEERSSQEYNAKIAESYYKSLNFSRDTLKAASKKGLQMGTREALGFVLAEVYFSAKEEIQKVPEGCSVADTMRAAGNGIRKGFENAGKNYKEILVKAGEGFTSGSLASFTNTLCNIFFTTSKSLAKYIRQIYSSVVQAGEILIINPDDLMLGDRVHQAAVLLALGASTIVGTYVGGLLAATPVGKVPVIGSIIVSFCSSLISGLLSCTLLVFVDRSSFMQKLVASLNLIPSEVNNLQAIAEEFTNLAAELGEFDYELFAQNVNDYSKAAEEIMSDKTAEEKNVYLDELYHRMNIKIPWTDDFDSFMGNKNNSLKFS